MLRARLAPSTAGGGRPGQRIPPHGGPAGQGGAVGVRFSSQQQKGVGWEAPESQGHPWGLLQASLLGVSPGAGERGVRTGDSGTCYPCCFCHWRLRVSVGRVGIGRTAGSPHGQRGGKPLPSAPSRIEASREAARAGLCPAAASPSSREARSWCGHSVFAESRAVRALVSPVGTRERAGGQVYLGESGRTRPCVGGSGATAAGEPWHALLWERGRQGPG